MIKAIIFDLGGVYLEVIDQVDYIASSFNVDRDTVLKNFEGLAEDYQKGKMSEKDFWLKFSQKIGKEFPAEYETLWTKGYAAKTRRNPEVVSVATRLKQKGYKLGVLSNTIQPHVKLSKEKNFFEGFDKVILSCEVGLRKPEKEIYLLAARELGVKPEDCICVDDREDYLQPARQLKMKAIHYKNPENLVLELKRLGVDI